MLHHKQERAGQCWYAKGKGCTFCKRVAWALMFQATIERAPADPCAGGGGEQGKRRDQCHPDIARGHALPPQKPEHHQPSPPCEQEVEPSRRCLKRAFGCGPVIAQMQCGVGNQPRGDLGAQMHAVRLRLCLGQRVPQPDQVEVKVAIDRCRQQGGREEEVARGDFDIHQRQFRGAVHAVKVDMFDAHQGDGDKDQRGQQGEPRAARIAGERVDMLDLGVWFGHGHLVT